jgi:hypothetical protein
MGLRSSSVAAALPSVQALGNAARGEKAIDPHGRARISESGHGHRQAWAGLDCGARSMRGATQFRRIGS